MSASPDEFDLLVIGAGSAGITAAREGLHRGARTALVSDGPPGGDCTFTGCVPSKTLLSAASQGASFPDAMGRVADTVATVAATEDFAELAGEGIEMVAGRARFESHGLVIVESPGPRRLRASRVVLATGSRPSIPDGVAHGVLTSDSVFDLETQPARLGVLGGGPVGCELAFAMARLGSQVTLFQRGNRLLPRDEPEASTCAAAALDGSGVELRLNAAVRRVSHASGSAEGTWEIEASEGVREVDGVLVATGRVPNTADLDGTRVGLRLRSDGAVVVDDRMATTADGVWAAGDVVGGPLFTHAAAEMARVAVANAFGEARWRKAERFDPGSVPWTTFLDPEIAHVGMTEDEAAKHGGRVAELPLSEVDRALTEGRTDGFVKLIAGPRTILRNMAGGRVLGATIVAPRAGEMIHEVALVMRTGAFTGRLAQTVHAYPTWSMGIQEAAAQFFRSQRGRTARPARRVSDR